MGKSGGNSPEDKRKGAVTPIGGRKTRKQKQTAVCVCGEAMVIIQLAGGLGNQMFQYALYLQLKSLGKEVKIDDESGFREDALRQPALAPFDITYERASRKELEQMLDAAPGLTHKIRRKLCGRKKKSYFEADKLFKPELFTWDDIYLEGYWQSEKYFAQVTEQVRACYDTDRLLKAYLQQDRENPYLQQIRNGQSVSVHIRRGDYLTAENQALFGNICTPAYYEKAMQQMKAHYPDCHFFIFTNDKEWVREQAAFAGREDITIVDIPQNERQDYLEFALMSQCKHQILANSSFSWWASYLNRNPQKTVLVPETWLNGWDCRDFYREDMQRVIVAPAQN